MSSSLSASQLHTVNMRDPLNRVLGKNRVSVELHLSPLSSHLSYRRGIFTFNKLKNIIALHTRSKEMQVMKVFDRLKNKPKMIRRYLRVQLDNDSKSQSFSKQRESLNELFSY